MRYALTSHGSGTKLSSLVEQTETNHAQSQPQQDIRRSNSGPKLNTCDAFFSPSQLLNSDDEDDFLMGLSMTSSHTSSKADGQEEGEGLVGVARKSGTEMEADILSFMQEYSKFSPLSEREKGLEREKRSTKPRRAASFSHSPLQKRVSGRTARNMEPKRSRSQTVQEHDFTPTPTYDLSPTAAIVPFKLPFLFQGMEDSRGSQGTLQSTSSHGRLSPARALDSVYESHKAPPTSSSQTQCAWDDGGGQAPLSILKQTMFLAQVLLDMARVRQGPIMLRSTDLVRQKLVWTQVHSPLPADQV